MTAPPAGVNATDLAAGDLEPLVPTVTADRVTADRVTADRVTVGEIADLLRHLAELRIGARGDDARDAAERAVFLARKAELFTRLAAGPSASTAPDDGRTR